MYLGNSLVSLAVCVEYAATSAQPTRHRGLHPSAHPAPTRHQHQERRMTGCTHSLQMQKGMLTSSVYFCLVGVKRKRNRSYQNWPHHRKDISRTTPRTHSLVPINQATPCYVSMKEACYLVPRSVLTQKATRSMLKAAALYLAKTKQGEQSHRLTLKSVHHSTLYTRYNGLLSARTVRVQCRKLKVVDGIPAYDFDLLLISFINHRNLRQ
jgi:hypothetical protein